METKLTPTQIANLNEWIAALRSGEYKQGRGRLKTRNGAFCCFGVVCDIQAKKGNGLWSNKVLFGLWSSGVSFFLDGKSYNSYPPPEMMKDLYGFPFKKHVDWVSYSEPQQTLARMNDSGISLNNHNNDFDIVTFSDIADALEDLIIANEIMFND